MKLSDLKEATMTHREYDSITTKVVDMLHSLFNVPGLVSQAKDSPYVQDKAKVDDAILSTIKKLDLHLDPHSMDSVVQRVKKILDV